MRALFTSFSLHLADPLAPPNLPLPYCFLPRGGVILRFRLVGVPRSFSLSPIRLAVFQHVCVKGVLTRRVDDVTLILPPSRVQSSQNLGGQSGPLLSTVNVEFGAH